MRNIFLFIRRYLNFIIFLVLQVICITILVKYNRTHNSVFNNLALESTGWVDKQYSGVENYFHLKVENKRLADENAALRNMLASNFSGPDTTKRFYLDSLIKDTTGKVRKYTWLPAKVVNNSISSQTNYITLERGANQGVVEGMTVVGPGNTMVGRVVSVSDNYSIVMSLLHRDSKVSSMLKKDGNSGMLAWDGESSSYLILRNISKSAKVEKGDTILTSTYAKYPYLMVGTVASKDADPSSNSYTIKVTPATNFSALQYVFLVSNVLAGEQVKLEEEIKKQNP